MEGQYSTIFDSQFHHTVNKHPGMMCSVAPSSDTKILSDPPAKRDLNHALKKSTIAVGVGVVLMSPFFILASKGRFSKINKNFFIKSLNMVTNGIKKLTSKPDLSGFERLSLSVLQKTSKFLTKARGTILQVTPLKDVLFEKCARKLKLGKVCDKITGFFEKMAVKMTANSYQKTSEIYKSMKDVFGFVNKKILPELPTAKTVEVNGISKTISDWTQIADEKVKNIDSLYDAFRPKAVSKRHHQLAKDFTGLGDEVFAKTYGDMKNFVTTPKRWTTFISEDIVAPLKLKFKSGIIADRKLITNTSSDVMKDINIIVSDIEKTIDVTNKESVGILKSLKKVLTEYKTVDLTKNPQAKQEFLNSLEKIIKENSVILSKEGVSQAAIDSDKIQQSLGFIKNIISADRPGELEQLLDIYKQILPEKEYKEVKKAASRLRTSLIDSTNTESDKFVDKMRDLNAGSALTDVFNGLLIPTVSTAVGMSMADTKAKKRSVVLNLGIPLLTGVMTSMVCTVALLSAGPSMALGLTTSFLTNQICSRVDKHFKKRDGIEVEDESEKTKIVKFKKPTT